MAILSRGRWTKRIFSGRTPSHFLAHVQGHTIHAPASWCWRAGMSCQDRLSRMPANITIMIPHDMEKLSTSLALIGCVGGGEWGYFSMCLNKLFKNRLVTGDLRWLNALVTSLQCPMLTSDESVSHVKILHQHRSTTLSFGCKSSMKH